MLSVATVRSAGGAANYFAADNYYTRADAERSGEWVGDGAKRLGLEGQIDAQVFEALLRGELPTGERVGIEGRHRAGMDLTFSMPKSWSLIGLVGGDTRVLDAYRAAVKETLRWAEKNAVETRLDIRGKERIVATGNLAIGLFQHDTNRNQEPNAHLHAVVANVTQGPDGKWRALRNDKLWALNTLLNSITMARFREKVEALGYAIGPVGKHGNFEAAGVTRDAIMAFSTRRLQLLEAAAMMKHQSPQSQDAATLMTRARKDHSTDRVELLNEWRGRAADIGLDLDPVVAAARSTAATHPTSWSDFARGIAGRADAARAFVVYLGERLGLKPGDPMIPVQIARADKPTIAAAHAIASAVRHLSEREAAFAGTDLLKAALDFALPTTVDRLEASVDRLIRSGHLVRGKSIEKGLLTTPDAVSAERRIIAEVEAGRGKTDPVLAPHIAGERLQATANLNYGLTLNAGQEAAGRLLLGSTNRIVAIQGIAGAGKSSLLRPVADLLRDEGRTVIGLAVQNTLVQMLERDTGIASMTLARFLRKHDKLLGDSIDPAALGEAKASMRGASLILDEASMVGNADKEKLVRLANLLGVDRLALVGDRKQLGAVDAGKPFALVQAAGIETAVMNLNIRARDKTLRAAQYAAQGGNIAEALGVLKDHIVEAPGNGALAAAKTWLALAPGARDLTSIYASGRQLRGEVNAAVQTGLRANGELAGVPLTVDTLSRVNATREQLRYAATYAPGQVVEIGQPLRSQGLARGRYDIIEVDARKELVTLRDRNGRDHQFAPLRIAPRAGVEPVQIYERRPLELFAGDRIRWTANDHKRGLFNADRGGVEAIDQQGVRVKTSAGIVQTLKRDDPMLERLDLAYALNAHMAQGLTSDRGIAVMDSRERNLANEQTFLVTITRLRDGLTLFVDNAPRLQSAIERNSGAKSSALETTGELQAAAARGTAKAAPEKSSAAVREPPELGKALVKPFEIGI